MDEALFEIEQDLTDLEEEHPELSTQLLAIIDKVKKLQKG